MLMTTEGKRRDGGPVRLGGSMMEVRVVAGVSGSSHGRHPKPVKRREERGGFEDGVSCD